MKIMITTLFALIGLTAIASEAEKESSRIIDLEPAQIKMSEQTPVLKDAPIPEMHRSLVTEDGFVLLKFTVNPSGRISDIEVLEKSNDRLAKYSMGMVRRWEFNRIPYALEAIQPIYFEAEKDTPTLVALR